MLRYALAAALLLATAGNGLAQQDPIEGASKRQRKPKPALPPPTEADLGVPVYPGARFDGDLSGGMSAEGQKIWIYFSDDAPGKVVAFYQQKTGKKADEWDTEKYMISLKGNSPLPEHGVTVETLAGNPLFEGKGKTVITVSRMAKN